MEDNTQQEQPAVENGSQGNGNGNGDSSEHSQQSQHTPSTASDDDRKLFVGGLSWETTDKDISEFFSKYGEIESVNLKMDQMTGRSRGFAFVVFKAVEGVEAVLAAGDLTVQGKKVEAKRAKARQGKIFVGGLPQDLTDEQIKAHFNAFGKVVEMEMPFDKIRNQRKGFCFITFESESSMKELLRSGKQTLGGKEVDVKRATPRQDMQGGPGGFMRGGRGGAGGFMRGGPGGMRGGPRGGQRGGGWGGAGAGGWGAQQWGQGYGGYGYDGYGSGGYEGYGGGYEGYGGGGYGGGYGAGGYGGGYGAQGGGAARGAGRGAARGQRYQPY